MDRYMVESPHDHENCTMVIRQVNSMGYLHHFDWGCEDGVHIGWAIIEAEQRSEALLVVPMMVRSEARAVRLVKYGSRAEADQAQLAREGDPTE